MRVLVVEDDLSVRETLGMVLEVCQHTPLLVADGEQALERLSYDWPDAMLLDLTLPGMSGEEVFKCILQKFGKAPPTIVLSAAQQGADRTSRLPGAYFLAKPYTVEQLEDMLLEATQLAGAA